MLRPSAHPLLRPPGEESHGDEARARVVESELELPARRLPELGAVAVLLDERGADHVAVDLRRVVRVDGLPVVVDEDRVSGLRLLRDPLPRRQGEHDVLVERREARVVALVPVREHVAAAEVDAPPRERRDVTERVLVFDRALDDLDVAAEGVRAPASLAMQVADEEPVPERSTLVGHDHGVLVGVEEHLHRAPPLLRDRARGDRVRADDA
ncbi:MAG: hypothetical protein KF894_03860 [Labilithrix sp.]|nr:hypothetical protein [Labilithrix sp.]